MKRIKTCGGVSPQRLCCTETNTGCSKERRVCISRYKKGPIQSPQTRQESPTSSLGVAIGRSAITVWGCRLFVRLLSSLATERVQDLLHASRRRLQQGLNTLLHGRSELLHAVGERLWRGEDVGKLRDGVGQVRGNVVKGRLDSGGQRGCGSLRWVTCQRLNRGS